MCVCVYIYISLVPNLVQILADGLNLALSHLFFLRAIALFIIESTECSTGIY